MRSTSKPPPVKSDSLVSAVIVVVLVTRSAASRNLPRQGSQSRQGDRQQRLAQSLVLDLVECLADEALDKKRAGLCEWNAARAQVEQQVVVELGGGGAVPTHHVVGEDLQLRLGVELCLLRQHQ